MKTSELYLWNPKLQFLGLFEAKEPSKTLFWVCLTGKLEKDNVLIQGQRTIGHWLKLAFWRPGAHLGTRAGILAPRRAFWRSGAHLGTRGGILALWRAFGHVGGNFCAQARIWARARAFWCSGAHLGTRTGILALGRALGTRAGILALGSMFGHEGRNFGV